MGVCTRLQFQIKVQVHENHIVLKVHNFSEIVLIRLKLVFEMRKFAKLSNRDIFESQITENCQFRPKITIFGNFHKFSSTVNSRWIINITTFVFSWFFKKYAHVNCSSPGPPRTRALRTKQEPRGPQPSVMVRVTKQYAFSLAQVFEPYFGLQ